MRRRPSKWKGTDFNKGYIDALLGRILPEKGFTIGRAGQRNEPGEVYRLG